MTLCDKFSWQRTAEALSALEALLLCTNCGKLPLQPCRYGNCEHVFCSICADGNETGQCTKCGVPSEAKERRADNIQSALAAGCVEMRALLDLQATAAPVADGAVPSSAAATAADADAAAGTAVPAVDAAPSLENGKQTDTAAADGCCPELKRDVDSKNVKAKEGPGQAPDTEQLGAKGHEAQLGETKKGKSGKVGKDAASNANRKSAVKATKSSGSVSSDKSKLGKSKAKNQTTANQPKSEPSSAPAESVAEKPRLASTSTPEHARRAQSCGSGTTSTPGATANLHKRNSKGETRLHAACVQGQVERVRTLLEAGAAANTQDHAGWTPLHEACDAGRLQLAQLLLSAGAVPDPPGHQLRTPLHEAVSAGRADVVSLLVRAGADPNARCLHGTTPRQLAEREGRADLLAAMSEPAAAAVASSPTEPTSEPDRPVSVAAADLSAAQHARLKRAASALGWKLASSISETTTHVVCSDFTAGVSLSRLRGLVVGAWLVALDWTDACTEAAAAVPAEPWEVSGEAGRRCRRRRRLLQPPLLTGLHIYLQGSFTSPSRAELTSLLQLAGARVISRAPNPEAVPPAEHTVPYHAPRDSPLRDTSHLVVFQDPPAMQYDMPHVKSLPLAWLLLSLETHTLADPIR